MLKKLLILIYLVPLLFPIFGEAKSKHLLFNRPADSSQARYVIDLMSIAYDKLGYKMHIIDFNHQSALAAANNGTLDGQLGRISSISEQYKNLHLIDFPLFEFNLILLKNCLHCSFEQLNSIAIQAGYPAAQDYLDNNPFIGNVVRVKSVTAQLNLLTQKKVSGLILLDFILHTKHPSFDMSQFQTEVFTPIQSFHFLHTRHKALIPKLEAELRRLNENGTVQFLRAKYQLD